MAGVADLLDRAVDLPPGPALAAVLEQPAAAAVPNARRVDVLRARSRQLAHAQAELFAELVELSHTVALAELDTAEAVARAAEQQEWAAPEIAAALTWTTGAADRELALATALVERLPLVQAALRHGNIDRSKARVFVEYLDPALGDITEEQAQALCERYLPPAPGLTTKQLADRLHRAVQAIDPALRRRRYERAVQARGVALYLDPRTGTATLVGNGLPAHEAAAAAARLDRLVETAKRAGHPGTRPQISADLYLGMLDGSFHLLTEEQIIQRLLTGRRPDDQPATVREGGAVREGIEIRLGLATAAGLDDRPGEIAGLGPVGASVARAATAAQRRGAAWRFAVVDSRGHLLLAGPLRRRPRTSERPPAVRGGVVELHVTLRELRRHGAHPGSVPAEWEGVLAEIAAAWADRHARLERLAARPGTRFARGALADHIRIRDRNCIGPGCTRPARRSDLDHTRDHSRGGPTVDTNIGPACRRHHGDEDRGWTLTQPEPGLFQWISPLGRVYRTRGEPIRPDLRAEPRPHPRRRHRRSHRRARPAPAPLRAPDPRARHHRSAPAATTATPTARRRSAAVLNT
ncbi:HNH endonuclease signature motif containing protein [Pseudonocardia zijingensis]|uniref:DUF222 domain-containing protein n=1 Tax=Pseudonocardia zijingensis TaxID=153376 RepID=A0ABP3ZYW0_9PSEU